jgi:hypothetical protein
MAIAVTAQAFEVLEVEVLREMPSSDDVARLVFDAPVREAIAAAWARDGVAEYDAVGGKFYFRRTALGDRMVATFDAWEVHLT